VLGSVGGAPGIEAMGVRRRIEGMFCQWAELVLKYRWGVVAGCLVLVALLATGLPDLRVEASFESYLPRDNAKRKVYEDFRRQFGSGERIVVLLQPRSLYDVEFLSELRVLHEALESELPHLDEVTSLVNARHLVGTSDTLISEDLLYPLPQNAADLAQLRSRIQSNPLYRNVLVSADETAVAILVQFDGREESSAKPLAAVLAGFDDLAWDASQPERGEMLDTEQSSRVVLALERTLDQHAPASTELFVAGTPLLAHRLTQAFTADIVLFVGASLACTAVLLFALFRNVWAVVHPLCVVGLSLVGTLGWMGWFGIPVTAVTEILPSLLVAVGVGDAVHVIAMFYKRRENDDDVGSSVTWAMGHSGLAVLLTSVTTAASMAAFQAAALQPIRDLGRAAPVGVGLALLFSTTLLPALLSITPMGVRSPGNASNRDTAWVDRILQWFGRIGMGYPKRIILGTAFLWLLASVGMTSLRFSQDDLRWFPPDEPIRIATEALNHRMHGAEPFELIVEVEPGSDLREPELLQAIAEIQRRARGLEIGELRVAQSLSLVDALEETHRALGDDPNAPLELPATRGAISQELLLFESAAPNDLEDLADSNLRTTRVAMVVPFVDALHYPRFGRAVRDVAQNVLRERGLQDRLTVTPTGLLMLGGETFELLFVSMARSYGIAFVVISLLMLVLVGDFRLGLLSMLPNLTPIAVILGAMGWFDSPLDISSMLVGGILIGVVVDDTIHFAHNFARYRTESGCAQDAIRSTLATTGRAMLVTSILLSAGFFAFTGATLSNIVMFGVLCGVGVVLAFLADVLMFPALIMLAAPCSPGCACRQTTSSNEAQRPSEAAALPDPSGAVRSGP